MNKFEYFLGNISLSTLLAKASFAFLLLSMLFYWFQTTFNTEKKAFIGKIPVLTMWLANITLAIMLFLRWVESGHFPLSNLYESLLFLSWSLTSIHLFVENVLNSKNIVSPILNLGSITSPLALFTNAFATFSLPQEMQKVTVLVPALQSNWLIMHVSVMMASYAALLSGSLLAMAFLVVKFVDDYGVVQSIEKYETSISTSAAALHPLHPTDVQQPYAVSSTNVSRKSKQIKGIVDEINTNNQVPQLDNSVAIFPLLGFFWLNSFQTLLKLIENRSFFIFTSLKKALNKVQEIRLGSIAALRSWQDPFCISIGSCTGNTSNTSFAGTAGAAAASQAARSNEANPQGESSETEVDIKTALVNSEQTLSYVESVEKSLNLPQILDNLSYRSIGLGFALLTIGIFSGAVWANEAWGSYWNWDPKETWALVTWLVFALYLHTRLSQGWVGKESAFVATFGFLVIWFCYLGVNLFGKGLHSYGWFSGN